MIKSFLKTLIGGIFIAGMLSASMSAYAATIDEVAQVARQLGYPEDTIQQGYNQYYMNPDEYTPEKLDSAIEELYRSMGMIFTTSSQIQPSEITTTTVVTDNDSNESTTVPSNNIEGITLKTDDGSEFTRISEKEFIALSYEEKMNYISTFTPEQQQVILNNLSSEERKSLLKQLPVEQKIQVADSMTSFAETFDLNVSVDEITEDNISLSMRNEEGELVGVANAGIIVEDTGYNRTGILALSAGFILTAVILLAIVSGFFRTGREK